MASPGMMIDGGGGAAYYTLQCLTTAALLFTPLLSAALLLGDITWRSGARGAVLLGNYLDGKHLFESGTPGR